MWGNSPTFFSVLAPNFNKPKITIHLLDASFGYELRSSRNMFTMSETLPL